MAYKNILVALDLSEETGQVVNRAKDIATEHGAAVDLLTVIRPLAYAYSGLELGSITEVSVNFEKEAHASALKQLTEIARAAGFDESRVHVVFGAPAPEIRAKAEQLDSDLIVLGTHGRHGLGLLLGSTANGVLHGAKRDVLAVRIQNS